MIAPAPQRNKLASQALKILLRRCLLGPEN
jgi:hypothetical protein